LNKLAVLSKKYSGEILVFIISFLSLSFLFFQITSNYYPTNDDITLIVNSTGMFKSVNPVKWFTEGYMDYFRVYPEWSYYSKEIVRPVANIIFFISGFLLGKNYFLYLYINILVHSIGVTLVFYLCKKYFEIGNILSCVAAFTFLFTPAVTNKSYFFYLSFVLDASVSIIIFISFICSIKNKSIIAFLFTFLALLTKETSLLFPFAVSLTIILIKGKEKLKIFAFAFLPILLWLIYKKVFGIGISAGIFSNMSVMWKAHVINNVRGLLIWPTGIPGGDIMSTSSYIFMVLLIIINLFLFVFILLDGFRQYRAFNTKYLIQLSWVFASLFTLIFFGLDGRFGYTFHLFFIPLIIYTIKISKSTLRKICYYVICISIVISGFGFFVDNLNPDEIVCYKHKMQNAKQLNELLKSIPDNSEVLLINDYTAVFGTPFLGSFAESKAKIIKVNSIANYNYFENDKNKISKLNYFRRNDTLVVQVDIPDYTDFWFEGVRPELFKHEAKKLFKRNENINICFPDEVNIGVSKIFGHNKYSFGKKMVLLINKKEIPIIWFDPANGKYEIIKTM
jgi:hypothetical protein